MEGSLYIALALEWMSEDELTLPLYLLIKKQKSLKRWCLYWNGPWTLVLIVTFQGGIYSNPWVSEQPPPSVLDNYNH